MSFYTSLSGLKAAQADLSTISNNVANVNSTAFKKSVANFGDIFSASPMQTTKQVAGQGVRVQSIAQQFTQGTIMTTDKTLDLAITGEGFFTVKGQDDGQVAYTRNGAFAVNNDRNVVDTTGALLQVIPVDPVTGAPTIAVPTTTSTLVNLNIPTVYPAGSTNQLNSVGVSDKGQISAIYADGTTVFLGSTAMTSFNSLEGLRQRGEAHWVETIDSGEPVVSTAGQGSFGSIQSGALERSNVDITDELVNLISAQRNFQANSKALEAANTLTQNIINLRS
jgi:flagellar hook protein FlgE